MAKKNAKNKQRDVFELLAKGVLHIFKNAPHKEFNYKQLSAMLLVKDQHTRESIQLVLKNFEQSGIIKCSAPGRYQYLQQDDFRVGTIDINRSGNAYLIADGVSEDLFIASENTHNALHGDQVKVKTIVSRRGKRMDGKVVEVIKRARSLYPGVIELISNRAFFIPDNSKIHVDFFIPKNALHGAEHGQKVLVSLESWEKHEKNPTGKVVKILGLPGENDAEIHAILAEFDLPYEFPEHVEEAAKKLVFELSEEELEKRRDFRGITTFTIDPFDAKDFDDALSVRQLDNGHTEIGVHIADVAHYVQPGTALDKEALNRATSVYLVDRVVPMLPEALSNGLCSLRPHEDKLCFSAVFELDAKAVLKNSWFGRTVIHSNRRFTYEEAQQIIEGESGDFENEIRTLDQLAKKLRKIRVQHGAIEFGSEEVKFQLDDTGKPVGVYQKVMKDSNKLIEEFMLLANRKVAELFGAVTPPKPMVYRVHDLPDPEKMRVLKDFLKNFGYKLQHVQGKGAAFALNQLLEQIAGKPEEHIIKQLAVRSMAKAIYTTENIGHYGLAFEYYTHFTSPIRRYPDIMVHRLLDLHLRNKIETDQSKLEMQAKQSTSMERKAVEAERASIRYMQVMFLKDRIGEEFNGIISGLSTWGIYVELLDNKCEGMIQLRNLQDDHYEFDDKRYVVEGMRWGRTFHLGDPIRIKVAVADLVRKQLDFSFVDPMAP
ncbi:MAG TPA: ribonuclease R [Luteibaculaceae bacterium]|nr:ribonuclease R [Luteibaculaceae bacterium]